MLTTSRGYELQRLQFWHFWQLSFDSNSRVWHPPCVAQAIYRLQWQSNKFIACFLCFCFLFVFTVYDKLLESWTVVSSYSVVTLMMPVAFHSLILQFLIRVYYCTSHSVVSGLHSSTSSVPPRKWHWLYRCALCSGKTQQDQNNI